MIAQLTGVKSSKKSYYTELKKTVEQLKKKNMQLEIMNEVMKNIKVDMPLEDILENMIDKLRVLVHFNHLSILLLRDNNNLTLTNVYPDDNRYMKIGSVISNEHSLYFSALKNRQNIFQQLNDSYASFYEKEYLTDLRLKTILVLPIYSKNKKIGVLSIGRHDESHWSIDDLAFLEQLTGHLAVSIENAQLYSEVLRAKQKWEDTFKAVDDMIIIFDKDINVLQFNDSAKTFFKIIEKSNFFILEEECKTLVRETFQSQKTGYKEIHLQDHTTCELYTYPVHNNEQQVYGVIAYIKDVTEKRRMAVQLLHSGKLAAIGEMAAGVAHELNSPLTAILGNSQLLLRRTTKVDPTYPLLNDIKNCGDRCKRIIKSLLTFSRQDEYIFDFCSLNEAVEQVLNLLRYQLEKQQIMIKLLLQEDLPLIEGSQQQIEQIIINLLLNAKDALELSSEKNKEIIIKTSLQSNEVHLSVMDNGIGIEENRLSKIFYPFHTTKETEKGTGLGLSVSIGIARTHGGTIEVNSKLNKGSTFTLKLPLQLSNDVEVIS
ncbi:PAS domain-containing sensor histidine kinase [Neobacillus cucumis]|uniref:PAS domain-containing sensor histidine kinase n=1 Tax=Neobacillus cucumis TaxID=1740721 RepID=UPI0028535E25|nr:ATP-binding protein [Neobacillus cucumis]MDR4950518.1 ATP-binding protein [Neobacillus cucumis]